jgi:uncharacterized protein YuzB (UPF0349 family)
MARLRITLASGEVSEHQITPVIEYSFEQYSKKGFSKAFREDEKQSDVFWLAYECLKRSGTMAVLPVFGTSFIELLAKVEVLDDDSPKESIAKV